MIIGVVDLAVMNSLEDTLRKELIVPKGEQLKMKPGDKVKQTYSNLYYCPFCQDGCLVYGQEYFCGLKGYPETDYYGNQTGFFVVQLPCNNYGYMLKKTPVEVAYEESLSIDIKIQCTCDGRDLLWFGCQCGAFQRENKSE